MTARIALGTEPRRSGAAMHLHPIAILLAAAALAAAAFGAGRSGNAIPALDAGLPGTAPPTLAARQPDNAPTALHAGRPGNAIAPAPDPALDARSPAPPSADVRPGIEVLLTDCCPWCGDVARG